MFSKFLKGVCVSGLMIHPTLASHAWPWHIAVNDVQQNWGFTRGNRTIVTVVDTKVEFTSLLKGKRYRPSKKKTENIYTREQFLKAYEDGSLLKLGNKTSSQAYADYTHGTGMTFTIAGNNGTLFNEDNHSQQLFVAGIAPGAKILDFAFGVDFSTNTLMPGLLDGLEEALEAQEEIKATKRGRKEEKTSKVFVVNLSAEESVSKASSLQDAEQQAYFYRDWLSTSAKQQDLLLIAAAGNAGMDLEKECSVRLQPVCVQPSKEVTEEMLLRVGSIREYQKGQIPQISIFSNYGPRYVDILAPGENISVLTPSGYAKYVSGTSPAAAIVSATAALLASCRPDSSAVEIKKSILDSADIFESLNGLVQGGRVLNIGKAIKVHCLGKKRAAYDNRKAGKTREQKAAPSEKDEL